MHVFQVWGKYTVWGLIVYIICIYIYAYMWYGFPLLFQLVIFWNEKSTDVEPKALSSDLPELNEEEAMARHGIFVEKTGWPVSHNKLGLMFPGTAIEIGDFLLLCFSRWVNLVGLCWVLRQDFTGSELPIEMRSFAFYEIVYEIVFPLSCMLCAVFLQNGHGLCTMQMRVSH